MGSYGSVVRIQDRGTKREAVEVTRKCTEETSRGKGENLGGSRFLGKVRQGRQGQERRTKTAAVHNLTEDMLPYENMELLSTGIPGE